MFVSFYYGKTTHSSAISYSLVGYVNCNHYLRFIVGEVQRVSWFIIGWNSIGIQIICPKSISSTENNSNLHIVFCLSLLWVLLIKYIALFRLLVHRIVEMKQIYCKLICFVYFCLFCFLCSFSTLSTMDISNNNNNINSIDSRLLIWLVNETVRCGNSWRPNVLRCSLLIQWRTWTNHECTQVPDKSYCVMSGLR